MPPAPRRRPKPPPRDAYLDFITRRFSPDSKPAWEMPAPEPPANLEEAAARWIPQEPPPIWEDVSEVKKDSTAEGWQTWNDQVIGLHVRKPHNHMSGEVCMIHSLNQYHLGRKEWRHILVYGARVSEAVGQETSDFLRLKALHEKYFKRLGETL